MKIVIKAKNLDLTGDLQKFVEEKIGSIKKFIDILKEDAPEKGKTLAEISVELEKETKHHNKGMIFLAKAQIRLPGKNLVAWSRSDDMLKAIIGVKDELKMEIEKYKFKNVDKDRREQRKAKRTLEIEI